ncbi:mitochondrial inner membrane protein Mpv17-like [Diadema antillarum]|uniref:mitochondrial inner membrane protein Mpv17-like n=1 Tax=Diadema antillarum TaxID=105358 RepID=UPI003A859BFF
MASVWRAYLRLLHKYPLRTQAVTSGSLFMMSDLISQELIERKGWEDYDGIRTLRQTLFGFCFAGPAMFTWYKTLDRLYPGAGKLTPLKKVLTDQTLFPPVFLVVYFSTVALTTGVELKAIPAKLKKDVPSTFMTGIKIWPPVQLMNFYLVPLHHRVLVVNVVALFWNTFLSWRANACSSMGGEAQ